MANAVASIGNQASQAASLLSSLNRSAAVPMVTSNDPTVLAKQAQSVLSQITQLQSQNGSSQQIQKLQQAYQAIQNRIHQQSAEQTSQQDESQTAPSKSFVRGVDLKA